jgi:hypothetical protein
MEFRREAALVGRVLTCASQTARPMSSAVRIAVARNLRDLACVGLKKLEQYVQGPHPEMHGNLSDDEQSAYVLQVHGVAQGKQER